jgi:hypothetical protein
VKGIHTVAGVRAHSGGYSVTQVSNRFRTLAPVEPMSMTQNKETHTPSQLSQQRQDSIKKEGGGGGKLAGSRIQVGPDHVCGSPPYCQRFSSQNRAFPYSVIKF